MDKPISEAEAKQLAAQLQRELLDQMQYFISALGGLETLEKTLSNPADSAVIRRTLNKLRDSYLSSSAIRRLANQQTELIERLIPQQFATNEAYKRGWADGLAALLAQLSDEDAELGSEVQQIVNRNSQVG